MADNFPPPPAPLPPAPEQLHLLANTKAFVGWLGGALAGLTAIVYTAGYLIMRAHLSMLGLYGLIDFNHDTILQEGAKFFLAAGYTFGRNVVSGDTLTTGPGTSAMLRLNPGGYVQLDENTDPLFREGLCLLIKVLHGQVLFSNVKCQQVEAVNLAFVAHSVVNLNVTGQQSRVTVLDGQVDLTVPGKAVLGRYAEYLVMPNAAPIVTQLTPEQAASRVAWQQRYFRVPTGQAPDQVSPVGAFLGGIFGFTQRDHRRPRQTDSAPAQQSPPANQDRVPGR